MPAVITENDVSQWKDDTGVLYHFPKRYQPILLPGTAVLYYKGRLRDKAHASTRQSNEAHYFGSAVIGKVFPDRSSSKGDLFATIEAYEVFANAVPIKSPSGAYFEKIPPKKETNYWRDGVREVSLDVFKAIVKVTSYRNPGPLVPSEQIRGDGGDQELESVEEGQPTKRYVTTYERNGALKKQAIAIHGHSCAACGVDMGKRYGPLAEGLIHVHHVVPISTFGGSRKVDPEIDLVPVCPNCHSVIHRQKSTTLSIVEVAELLRTFGG